MDCTNCLKPGEGNYCEYCGQKMNIERVSLKELAREFVYSLTHAGKKGLFYTIKELFVRPGTVIQQFLEGQRKSLYPPMSYLILTATISTFLTLKYHFFTHTYSEQSINIGTLGEFFAYAEKYTTIINIITIPVFAFCTHLIFVKSKYNFAENVLLNVYITSQQLVLLVLFIPLVQLLPALQSSMIELYTLLTIIYNVWVLLQFFKVKSLLGFSFAIAAVLFGYLLQFVVNYSLFWVFETLLQPLI
jgi:hypothetical protein